MSAIEIEDVAHDYGARRALDGLSFQVRAGEVFGLLGPNGGGKTTLFRILATLMAPTAGHARVLGLDTVEAPAAVRRKIGVVFQSPSLDRKLTVSENLAYQGALYGMPPRGTRERAAEMLQRVGLADRAAERVERVEKLSGGLRRRVELAKGLLHAPDVLLLDEPSTGLDPGGRRDLWTYLEEIRDGDGVTSLLTTHLMEEAERCDRLAILDHGRLVALGTPAALRAEIGGDVLTLTTADPDTLRGGLSERFGLEPAVVDGKVRLEHAEGHVLIPQLVEAFPEKIEAVAVGKPTLEDVFVKKTGHRFWSEDEA
ncbi:MAG: ABC transporter ATP-binding protein [Planctomycetota bacterium]